MRADDLTKALDVGRKWTRQVKAEERSRSARRRRASIWSGPARVTLKDLCSAFMQEAWDKASDQGRLPTHWRQLFYVMRQLCDQHLDGDRQLIDSTFKNILEGYLDQHQPGWDVLRGARGVFKEPHAADHGLAMSTLNVREYLHAARRTPDASIQPISPLFPTRGAHNRIAAVLICEKEGFDELLQAEQLPERYDLALMSTKGISALAARHLAADLGVPCFTLHDLDKNGFVMAAGFPFATDIGLRLADVDEWGLAPEEQRHDNPARTYRTLLRNGATEAEADFVANGRRVELNMLTGPQLIAFVEQKLDQHRVEKVIPDHKTLAAAWKRAQLALCINRFIQRTCSEDGSAPEAGRLNATVPDQEPTDIPPPPANLADSIRAAFDTDPKQSWDEALATLVERSTDDHVAG